MVKRYEKSIESDWKFWRVVSTAIINEISWCRSSWQIGYKHDKWKETGRHGRWYKKSIHMFHNHVASLRKGMYKTRALFLCWGKKKEIHIPLVESKPKMMIFWSLAGGWGEIKSHKHFFTSPNVVFLEGSFWEDVNVPRPHGLHLKATQRP